MAGGTCPSSQPWELQADAPPVKSEPGWRGSPAKTRQVPWDHAFWLQEHGIRGPSCSSASTPEAWPQCDFRGMTRHVVTRLWEAWL